MGLIFNGNSFLIFIFRKILMEKILTSKNCDYWVSVLWWYACKTEEEYLAYKKGKEVPPWFVFGVLAFIVIIVWFHLLFPLWCEKKKP